MVLTRAEFERRIRERSKHAALKIAEQRSKEGQEREFALRRKAVAKDVSDQIQRENARPRSTGRSARIEHRQRSSCSGGRNATRRDSGAGVGRRNAAGENGLRKGAAAHRGLPFEGGRRHEETLAFMARQRRQACLDARQKEEEQKRKAENLRIALENIEQTRQRAMSQRPARSRSRRRIQRSSGVREDPAEVGRSTGKDTPREGWRLRRAKAPSAARELEAPPAISITGGAPRGDRARSKDPTRASARRTPSDRPEAIGRHPPSRESRERGMSRRETGNKGDVVLQRGLRRHADDGACGEGNCNKPFEAGVQRPQLATLQDDGDGRRDGGVRGGSVRGDDSREDSARRETGAVREEGSNRRQGGSGGFGAGEAASMQRNTPFEGKLPYILASLEKTALVVLDLQRRCSRLSDVIDRPRAVPPPRRPRSRQEERASSAPSLDVLGGTEEQARKRPPPRSSFQIDQPNEDLSSRPAIAVPIPVVLPPREPAPFLQPSTPSPIAAPPGPSPVLSVGLSSTGRAQPSTPSPIAASPCPSPVLSVGLSSTGRAPLSSGSTAIKGAELTCQSLTEGSREMAQPGHSIVPAWPTEQMPAPFSSRPVGTVASATVSCQALPRDRVEHSIAPTTTPHSTSGVTGGLAYEREVEIPSARTDRDASRGAFAPPRRCRKQPSELSDEEVSSTGSPAKGVERGGASWESSSLVSLVAGDILRAREKETLRQQQEKEAAAAAAASAAAIREHNEAYAALNAWVEEAVSTSAKEVAEEELRAEENKRATRKMSAKQSRAMEGAPVGGSPCHSTAASSVLIDPQRELEATRATPSGNNDNKNPLGDTSEEMGADRRGGCDERSPDDGNGRGEAISVGSQQREDGDSRSSVAWNKLAPVELQAQLMNELRLHDDLQDVELRMDRLVAAQQVKEARQEARFAGMLLGRERVAKEKEDARLAQQQEFEEALARNDATHEVRLRQEKTHADERFARSAEATATAVAAAAAASFGAQGRQAEAAIAAVEAATAHAQHQQASAMAAQTAMFMAIQREDRLGSNSLHEGCNIGGHDTGVGDGVACHSGLSRDGADWRMDGRASRGSERSTNATHSPIDQAVVSGKGYRGGDHDVSMEAKQDGITEAFTADQLCDGRGGLRPRPRHSFDDFMSDDGPRCQRPQSLCSKLGGDVGTGEGALEATTGVRDLAARDEDAMFDYRTIDGQRSPRLQLQSTLSMEPRGRRLGDYDTTSRSFRSGKTASLPSPPALAADEEKEEQGVRGGGRVLLAVAGDKEYTALDDDELVAPRMVARQYSDRRQRPSPISTKPLERLRYPAAAGGRPTTSARGVGSGENGGATSVESATVTEPEPWDLFPMEERALAEEEVKLLTVEKRVTAACYPRTLYPFVDDGGRRSQDTVGQTAPAVPSIENVLLPRPGEKPLYSSAENEGQGRSEANISSQFTPTLPPAPGQYGGDASVSDGQISPRVQTPEDQVKSDAGTVSSNARASAQSPDGEGVQVQDTGMTGKRSGSWALTAHEQRGSSGGPIVSEARMPSQQAFMLAAKDGNVARSLGWDDSRSFLDALAGGDQLLSDSESDNGDVHLESKRGEGTPHADDKYELKCRVTEDILEELVSDTMRECERLCGR